MRLVDARFLYVSLTTHILSNTFAGMTRNKTVFFLCLLFFSVPSSLPLLKHVNVSYLHTPNSDNYLIKVVAIQAAKRNMHYSLSFITTLKEKVLEKFSGLMTPTELCEVRTQQSTGFIYLVILFS